MNAPKSVTNTWCNMTGLLGFFLGIYLLRFYLAELAPFPSALVLMLATALPILFFEIFLLKSFRNPSTGIDFSLQRPIQIPRVCIKLLALYAIFGFIALIYFAFPEYRGEFYTPYYTLLRLLIPVASLLAIPYFLLLDQKLVDPEDSYWKLGMALLRKRDFSKENLQLLLGWMVKAFFLPLMFIYFTHDVDFISHVNVTNIIASFSNSYEFLFKFFFAIDLLYVSIGYICTFRILDAHIRTTEPTFFGWGIALLCYQPFWNFFSSSYLSYSNDKQWGYWFANSPFYTVWGLTILSLLGIYIWATLAFGIRFSNLTNRGILTNGPYRYTKHPAYISKNLAWWMISMPFMISTSFQDSARHTLLLLALNAVYFMRAKTEERHLGQDPVYRDYVRFIEKHGIFAKVWRTEPKTVNSISAPRNEEAC